MAIKLPTGEDSHEVLYGNFAFHVQFAGKRGPFLHTASIDDRVLGAFSEISGIEASMEHKVLRQGGVNYGARMLAGPVSFGTVILKRGVARSQVLWRWWSMFAGADKVSDGRPVKANRSDVLIGLITQDGSAEKAHRSAAMGWKLRNAMPVKFRVADLNAKGTDVAVEELHLVHEGLDVAGVVR